MFGFSLRVFAEELGSGELDKIIITIHDVWSTGKLDGGKIMTDGKGDFLGEQAGVRRYDASAKNAVSFVADKFNETIVKIMSFAGSGFAEINDGLFVFTVATEEVVFGETNDGDFGLSVSGASETAVINWSFGIGDKVGGQSDAFMVGAVGGRFAA